MSSKGYDVKLIDKHLGNIKKINSGKIPFLEKGAGGLLKKMLKKKKFLLLLILSISNLSKFIIVCIGTPIDKNLNPETKNFVNFFQKDKKNIFTKIKLLLSEVQYTLEFVNKFII